MTKLEDVLVGTTMLGVLENTPVSIIAREWHGDAVLEIFYKTFQNNTGSMLLYREDQERLSILDKSLSWNFSADIDAFKLVSEAHRIRLAHLFDPYIAVYTSQIEPLPHQISAVYKEMLHRLSLRYVLADDPGAGKTIMTGLYIKEMINRSGLKRCLIVTPGNLAEQWQDELYQKFNLKFELITNDRIASSFTGNIFNEIDLCIARLDKLSRSDDIKNFLNKTEWDLIVCDEAHKMSATVFGGEAKYTKRYNLGKLLSSKTRHFLLLTATPHNGKEADFQLFMSLVDQDRFEGVSRNSHLTTDNSDVMRRYVKEELVKFDGTPLFPERIAYTVNYDLTPEETELYDAVTNYVQAEFNRADNLSKDRKNTVGFALTILQRRLASSPEAIYQSLKRRKERLEKRLLVEKEKKDHEERTFTMDDDYDDDDFSSAEMEEAEDEVIDQATAAQTIAELEAEIEILKSLESIAHKVRLSGKDKKWDELSKLIQENELINYCQNQLHKLIIFTEHRDTLNYLCDRLSSTLGKQEAVVNIHGGIKREDRRKVEELFKHDKNVRILVATDAAGEGINLQRSHLMINYDLPWNPNRLEQRFGRIHRIGQTEVCHLWILIALKTREGDVFKRLFEKLEQKKKSLKGKVFDILGKVTYDNKPLKELLIEAIRYGNDPEVRKRLHEVVDSAFDHESLEKLIEERALTDTVVNTTQVNTIREDMERMEAHKLQPHFIKSFFIEAFKTLQGNIKERENGRYEIVRVPNTILNKHSQLNTYKPLLDKYERICFDKNLVYLQNYTQADFISPGHPLLDTVIEIMLERSSDLLTKGTIFIDENDFEQDIRILFYLKTTISDNVILPNGKNREISNLIHFIEIKEDKTIKNMGYAPYLDYGTPDESELEVVKEYIESQDWLNTDIKNLGIDFAITEIIPKQLTEVKERKLKLIDKTQKAVKERLEQEIRYWDNKAIEFSDKEKAGKVNAKQNSQVARKKADELEERLKKRMADLEAEKNIFASSPEIYSGAIVVPIGLLNKLTDKPDSYVVDLVEKKRIELKAMQTVFDIETDLGFIPVDVSKMNTGYDIESNVPLENRKIQGYALRFIEVKGRVAGADTITVTKNEILTALNKPENYILAIVEIDDEKTKTTYLKKPFTKHPDFASVSVTYNIKELFNNAEIILER